MRTRRPTLRIDLYVMAWRDSLLHPDHPSSLILRTDIGKAHRVEVLESTRKLDDSIVAFTLEHLADWFTHQHPLDDPIVKLTIYGRHNAVMNSINLAKSFVASEIARRKSDHFGNDQPVYKSDSRWLRSSNPRPVADLCEGIVRYLYNVERFSIEVPGATTTSNKKTKREDKITKTLLQLQSDAAHHAYNTVGIHDWVEQLEEARAVRKEITKELVPQHLLD